MDKNAMMQDMARAAYEKGGSNGAWLYAEKGEIVSKGVVGWRDRRARCPSRRTPSSSWPPSASPSRPRR